MICYKDRTFCEYYKECRDGDGCFRALTPKVEHNANIWWQEFRHGDAPICVFTSKPLCFVEKIETGE